jgi:hypothetical protein
MKYLVCFVLIVIISILVLPIMLIKWDDSGIDNVFEGIKELCGID